MSELQGRRNGDGKQSCVCSLCSCVATGLLSFFSCTDPSKPCVLVTVTVLYGATDFRTMNCLLLLQEENLQQCPTARVHYRCTATRVHYRHTSGPLHYRGMPTPVHVIAGGSSTVEITARDVEMRRHNSNSTLQCIKKYSTLVQYNEPFLGACSLSYISDYAGKDSKNLRIFWEQIPFKRTTPRAEIGLWPRRHCRHLSLDAPVAFYCLSFLIIFFVVTTTRANTSLQPYYHFIRRIISPSPHSGHYQVAGYDKPLAFAALLTSVAFAPFRIFHYSGLHQLPNTSL